jgi:hypothetical protein
MKNKIMILVVVLTTNLIHAQGIKDVYVPSEVKATLFTKYKEIIVDKIDTVEIKWVKRKSAYRAQFHENNEDHWVTIDNQGNWLETRDQIETSALPKTVTIYLKDHYPNQKPSAASKIESTSCTLTYEVKIGTALLHFDTYGSCVRPKKAKKETVKKITKIN